MEAKATILLDGQEISLLISACVKRSEYEFAQGNRFRGRQFLIIADKLEDAKKNFHQQYHSRFASKYLLPNEEKPSFAEPTFQ